MAKKTTAPKNGLTRAHIKIYGSVQNVGFRFYAHRKAASANLTGWVKNADGDQVEIVFEGDKKAIERCVEECRHGPLFSKVDKLEIDWQKPTGEFKHFEVR
ncbi:MAG: acylphosphatase [Patescibacteria group bacterium]